MIRANLWFLKTYPDLWKLFWSNVLWSCGSSLYFFVWPNYVRDLGGGPQEIGYLTGLMYGVMALTLLPGGWLADRFDRRRLMLANWALAALAPLFYARARTWPELIPGVFLYALFFGWPAMEAYVADAVPPESLGRAFVLTNSGYALGAIIPPLLGAALWKFLGMRGLFLLSFLAFASSTTLIGLMRPQRPSYVRADRSPEPLNRGLLLWLFIFTLTSAASAGARPFLAPFLEDVFRLGRAFILACGSLLALGEFLLAWPLGHESERSRTRAIFTALGLCALGSGLFLLPYGFIPGLFLMGGDRVVYSLLRSVIGAQVRVGRGKIFASTQVLATGAEALAPLATGWLYSLNPHGPLMLFRFVFTGFAVFLLLRRAR
ncbi:MFS transporter [Candidatus Bipolaricaulota bacterium]|nr:MFS transporter [Candidatus Bipolaricaulota bacterium]